MDTPPLADSPASAVVPSTFDKLVAIACHLSLLLGLGLGTLIPFIVWLVSRRTGNLVESHSRSALNFHLSLIIYLLIAWVAVFFTIGFSAFVGVGARPVFNKRGRGHGPSRIRHHFGGFCLDDCGAHPRCHRRDPRVRRGAVPLSVHAADLPLRTRQRVDHLREAGAGVGLKSLLRRRGIVIGVRGKRPAATHRSKCSSRSLQTACAHARRRAP